MQTPEPNSAAWLEALYKTDPNLAAQLVGEVVQYKDGYRLCYNRGPEGLLSGLAQEVR